MKTEELHDIKTWFLHYVENFADADRVLHPMLNLKVEHTGRVAGNAERLAKNLNWPSSKVNAAEALGWLHDTGRFPQFADFGTFDDAQSVDHGECGRNVIHEAGVLASLADNEHACILAGIRYHNAKVAPDDIDGEHLAFVQLIRDADKLDIFQVVRDAVKRDGFQALPEMLPQVILDGPINPKLTRDLQSRRCCSMKDVGSLADFLLMQMSWIYDVNYAPTFQQIAEHGIIEELARMLPDKDSVDRIVQNATSFVKEKTKQKGETAHVSNA